MSRRAMTLIEVVAATVLLSLLAVAVVPVLRDGRAQVESRGPRLQVFELGLLADRAVADPVSLGLDRDWSDGVGQATSPWRMEGTAIQLRRVGAWVIFESGDSSVARYLPIEEPES